MNNTDHIIALSRATPVSMANSWYELATPEHFWMKWRTNILGRLISLHCRHNNRGLDIGCGHGVLLRQLESLHPITIDGCDLNRAALAMARAGRGKIYQYNIFDCNPDLVSQYDFAMLIDVIEHLEDDVSFLRAAQRHVKPGGIVILNVPALPNLFGPYDTAAGHLRRYSAATLTASISAAGLQPEKVFYWGMSLIPLLVIRNLTLMFTHQDEIIRRGFHPPHPLMNSALDWLRHTELSIRSSWPIGSSLAAVARVPS